MRFIIPSFYSRLRAHCTEATTANIWLSGILFRFLCVSYVRSFVGWYCWGHVSSLNVKEWTQQFKYLISRRSEWMWSPGEINLLESYLVVRVWHCVQRFFFHSATLFTCDMGKPFATGENLFRIVRWWSFHELWHSTTFTHLGTARSIYRDDLRCFRTKLKN